MWEKLCKFSGILISMGNFWLPAKKKTSDKELNNHFPFLFHWLASGFDKDPKTSKFEIYANVDQLSLIGQYKIKGSVIILPVVGHGPANLTFGKYILCEV